MRPWPFYLAPNDCLCCLQSIGIALKKHPSIWISSLLVFLILAIGGIIGVVAVASNETYQRHQAAEGGCAPCVPLGAS